jgi:hypothetical protein
MRLTASCEHYPIENKGRMESDLHKGGRTGEGMRDQEEERRRGGPP